MKKVFGLNVPVKIMILIPTQFPEMKVIVYGAPTHAACGYYITNRHACTALHVRLYDGIGLPVGLCALLSHIGGEIDV